MAPLFLLMFQIFSWENQLWLSNICWLKWAIGAVAAYGEFSLQNGALWLCLSKGSGLRQRGFIAFFLQVTYQEVNIIPTNHNSKSTNNNKKICALCQCHMLLLFPKYPWTAAFQPFPLLLFSQHHPSCFSWQNLRVYQSFASWLRLGFLLWKYPVAHYS